MGKASVECPRCGKKVKINWDDKKPWILKNLKGANWYPLLKKTENNQWIEDWREGIAVHCKCDKAYFVHNLIEESGQNQTETTLKQDFSVAWFCEPCGKGFMNSEMKCPTCNMEYI
ncbi:MAG: hypothetical protein ACXABN_06195 [Candidatus Thorarchaeota archaeon]|jgi:DNA-directed RNA polymerase subunit RPC12/RpoP